MWNKIIPILFFVGAMFLCRFGFELNTAASFLLALLAGVVGWFLAPPASGIVRVVVRKTSDQVPWLDWVDKAIDIAPAPLTKCTFCLVYGFCEDKQAVVLIVYQDWRQAGHQISDTLFMLPVDRKVGMLLKSSGFEHMKLDERVFGNLTRRQFAALIIEHAPHAMFKKSR